MSHDPVMLTAISLWEDEMNGGFMGRRWVPPELARLRGWVWNDMYHRDALRSESVADRVTASLHRAALELQP